MVYNFDINRAAGFPPDFSEERYIELVSKLSDRETIIEFQKQEIERLEATLDFHKLLVPDKPSITVERIYCLKQKVMSMKRRKLKRLNDDGAVYMLTTEIIDFFKNDVEDRLKFRPGIHNHRQLVNGYIDVICEKWSADFIKCKTETTKPLSYIKYIGRYDPV